MAILKVRRNKVNVIVENFYEVKKNSSSFFTRINILTFLMFFFAIFSPTLWIFSFMLIFLLFNIQIWNRYFKYPEIISYYLNEFSCVAADDGVEVFSNFGYTVDKDYEWDRHRQKLKNFKLPDDAKVADLKDYAETLAEEVKKVKTKQKYRMFGVGADVARRHILFIGTTGAGKTETIMSWLNDVLKIENSGGVIFIDGKADTAMHTKLSWLVEKHNRMTSFYSISFLKSDKMPFVNTYNPILTMSPYKAVNFMSSLLPSGEGGNADYFKNRGIAMLTLPLSALRIRSEFYNESFSLAVLQSSTSTINISILFFLFYGMIREQNDIFEKQIKEGNSKLAKIWKDAVDKSVAIHHDVQYYEKILNYVTQYNPAVKSDIEDIIGYDFKLFFQAFNITFQMTRMYMGEISPDWLQMANATAEAMYVYAKNYKHKNFGINYQEPVSIEDIRRWKEEISNPALIEEIVEDELYKSPENTKEFIINGLGLNKNSPVTLENLQEQQKMQHGYAQQQWTSTFNSFNEFPNVFGSPFPDVDMKDIMKNNKILYVLLPIQEVGEEKAKILGKMIIRDLQEAASVALGGEKLNITPTRRRLYEDKIKPKPLSLIIADEYGYYRVESNEMASILAQFRSLNIAVIISIQNVANLGKDEATKATLANTAKFVLKSYDKDIREFVESQIGETQYLKTQKYFDPYKNVKESIAGNVEIEKEKTFDVSILGDLTMGCGLFICDSKPVIVQSYYFGGGEVEPYVASMEKYVI